MLRFKFILISGIFLFLAISTSTVSQAQTKIWTGAIDTLWSKSGNWSPSGAPGPGDNIEIPIASNQPTATSTITIFSGDTLSIDSGAALNVRMNFTGGDGLNIRGVLRNSGSIFTYQTGADGVEITGSGTAFNYESGYIRADSAENSGLFIREGGAAQNWGKWQLIDSDFSGFEIYGTFNNYDTLIVENSRFELIYMDVVYILRNYGNLILNNALINDALVTAPVGGGIVENGSCAKLEVLSNDNINDFNDVIVNNGLMIDRSSATSSIDINNGLVQNLNGGTFNINTNNGTLTTSMSTKITRSVTDTTDSGEGSLRQVILCSESGDTITFAASVANETINLTSDSIILDKDLFFVAEPADSVLVDATAIGKMFYVAPMIHCIFDGVNLKSGSAPNGGIFRNLGALTLRNLSLEQHPSPGSGYRIFGSGNYILEKSVNFNR